MTAVATLARYAVPALFLQVGHLRTQIDSYAEASELFCATRDAYGEGASRTPTALLVYEDGRVVGHVSYNGRVWAGAPQSWTGDTALFYDNRDSIKSIGQS